MTPVAHKSSSLINEKKRIAGSCSASATKALAEKCDRSSSPSSAWHDVSCFNGHRYWSSSSVEIFTQANDNAWRFVSERNRIFILTGFLGRCSLFRFSNRVSNDDRSDHPSWRMSLGSSISAWSECGFFNAARILARLDASWVCWSSSVARFVNSVKVTSSLIKTSSSTRTESACRERGSSRGSLSSYIRFVMLAEDKAGVATVTKKEGKSKEGKRKILAFLQDVSKFGSCNCCSECGERCIQSLRNLVKFFRQSACTSPYTGSWAHFFCLSALYYSTFIGTFGSKSSSEQQGKMAASLWRSSGEIGDVVKNRIGESVTSDSHLQKEKIGSLTNRIKRIWVW